jgi:hypothetical protein
MSPGNDPRQALLYFLAVGILKIDGRRRWKPHTAFRVAAIGLVELRWNIRIHYQRTGLKSGICSLSGEKPPTGSGSSSHNSTGDKEMDVRRRD